MIILCLYDAANVAPAGTVGPLRTHPAGVLDLMGLRNAIPEGSRTNQQGNQSDVLAFRFQGVEQPGSARPSSTMQASAAMDDTAAKTTAQLAAASTPSGQTSRASETVVD